MDPRIRYCVELDQIKNIPAPNRIRTETRFFLLKEFSDLVEPRGKQLLGRQYRKKPSMQAYCQDKGISLTSLFRWQREYCCFGIVGLIPRFGNRGVSRGEKHKQPHIKAIIDIDPLRPLRCLHQLLTVINTSPGIPPERAKQATSYLERTLPLLKRQTWLTIPRSLTAEEQQELAAGRAGTHKNQRDKALALLMISEGCTMEEVAIAAGRSPGTIYRWLRLFRAKGLAFIKTRVNEAGRAALWHERTLRVIAILHEAPRFYGINRPSWTVDAIRQVYRIKHGEGLSTGALRSVLQGAGYSWKHARKVLTSPDPDYREKLGRIIDALHGLQPAEAFFFIDEAGPWRVKMYGGKALVAKGEARIIPEVQSIKGTVYLIAALEAQTNQVVWQFTGGKSAAALVSLLKAIRLEYGQCPRICLTWDALSSHSAWEVNHWIAEANANRQAGDGPLIEVYPLPSSAQFLNLVESTFSSLRRAVIHNSDYASKEEMQAAISRYFEERNTYFREHPKRAGNKIWDRETLKIDELPGGLFRRM